MNRIVDRSQSGRSGDIEGRGDLSGKNLQSQDLRGLNLSGEDLS